MSMVGDDIFSEGWPEPQPKAARSAGQSVEDGYSLHRINSSEGNGEVQERMQRCGRAASGDWTCQLSSRSIVAMARSH